MKRIFKHLKVVDPNSKWNGKRVDVLVQDDKILEINKNIPAKKIKVFDFGNICISPGWLDIGTQIGEPGYEHRENIQSVSLAAKKGGFTGIAAFPNTNPVLQSKSEIQYIINQSKDLLVDIFPIGAISHNCDGKDLNEMIDMQFAGAIAFSDGRHSMEDAGLLLRALEYSKSTGKPIIHHPELNSLSHQGLMHEGKWSTRLGTVGIPSMSEELCAVRDIALNEYAGAQLITHLITAKETVNAIKKAKTKKTSLAATVGYMHLLAQDDALAHFDVNYKIQPPLRESKDRKALIKGIKDGTIDAIVSHHEPREEEIKDLEFSYAAFGVIGLQTCFPALNTHLGKDISLELLVEKLCIGPRKILQLPIVKIEENQEANFTLFDPDHSWSLSKSMLASKSKNSPFIAKNLNGAVFGVYNNKQFWANPDFIS
jgi:dihydroorotase